MAGAEGEAPQIIGQEIKKKERAPNVKRTQRKASKTYDFEPTPYKEDHKQFGEVRLRKDWGAEFDMDPVDLAKLIKACISYAKKKGRLDVLKKEMAPLAKDIQSIIDKYEGLRGIESERFNTTVTDVPERNISADKADVVKVREEAGAGFPQFAKEVVLFSVTLPEEDIEKEEQRQKVDVGRMLENFPLFLLFSGISEETQRTNVKVQRKMGVTDRERLFELVNEGIIGIESAGIEPGRRLDVDALRKSPEPKNGENGNGN